MKNYDQKKQHKKAELFNTLISENRSSPIEAFIQSGIDDLAKEILDKKESENVTRPLKIAIAVHVYYLDVVDDILDYLVNIDDEYTLFCTVDKEKKGALLKILEKRNIKAEVIIVENIGYDILPFLQLLPLLKKQNFDIVCKLHTKKDVVNIDKSNPEIESSLWFRMLLDSVLGSKKGVEEILSALKNDKEIGMISSAELFLSAQRFMFENHVDSARLLNVLDENFDSGQDWGFTAGSMFWARLEIFDPVIDKIELLNNMFRHDVKMSKGSHDSIFHAMEKVFGALPVIAGKKTVLTYITDRERKVLCLNSDGNDEKLYSHLSAGLTLLCENNINKNYELVKESGLFDENYYAEVAPEYIELNMDPVIHFLRYGMYLNKAPNAEFSPYQYLSLHLTVYRERVNPLVDYILNHRDVLPADGNVLLAQKIIRKSHLFDGQVYKSNNPYAKQWKGDPLLHYCTEGYKHNRNVGIFTFPIIHPRVKSIYLGS